MSAERNRIRSGFIARRRFLRWCSGVPLVVAILTAQTPAASAEDSFPDRPIRIIAPIAAGGPSDTAARLFAKALTNQLKQRVIVENHTGAGGVVGTEFAAQSRPDGYTLLLSIAATFSVIPAVKNVQYNTEKDFVPLGQIWQAPQALVVRTDSKFKSLSDLIAYAKKNPNKVTFGSAGVGTTTHLSIVLLSQAAGIQVVHVPYRGTSESVKDVLASQIDAIFGDAANVAPYVSTTSANGLRALAVTGPQRSSVLPDVPTTGELGYPGISTVNWYGLHALVGTPTSVLAKLRIAVRAAQEDPDYAEMLKKHGATTGTLGAEAFGTFVHEDAQRLQPVLKSLGLNLN